MKGLWAFDGGVALLKKSFAVPKMLFLSCVNIENKKREAQRGIDMECIKTK